MFLRNRESTQHHIVRKLRAKYVDKNPFFNPWVPQSDEDPYKILEIEESPLLTSIMNYINIEVGKMLRSKRITEETLSELDSRIAIEVYLREKKFAILEDRLNEAVNDESGASPLAA